MLVHLSGNDAVIIVAYVTTISCEIDIDEIQLETVLGIAVSEQDQWTGSNTSLSRHILLWWCARQARVQHHYLEVCSGLRR